MMTKSPFPPTGQNVMTLRKEKYIQVSLVLLLKVCSPAGVSTWLLPVTVATWASMSSFPVTTGRFNCLPQAVWSRHAIQSYTPSTKHRKPMTQRNARRKKVSEKTFAVAKILQGKTSLRGDYWGLHWLRHGKPRAQFVPCLPPRSGGRILNRSGWSAQEVLQDQRCSI